MWGSEGMRCKEQEEAGVSELKYAYMREFFQGLRHVHSSRWPHRFVKKISRCHSHSPSSFLFIPLPIFGLDTCSVLTPPPGTRRAVEATTVDNVLAVFKLLLLLTLTRRAMEFA